MKDIRMKILQRAADELEVTRIVGDAKAVAAAQLRFDRLFVKVLGNRMELRPLQKSEQR